MLENAGVAFEARAADVDEAAIKAVSGLYKAGLEALKKKIEDKGEFYTYEVYMNYSCVLLLADALERAASADRAKIIAALESSTFSGHVMPYGPTKFVNGQNQGAAPVNTQVLGKDIQVILPAAFASAKAVFPMPPA